MNVAPADNEETCATIAGDASDCWMEAVRAGAMHLRARAGIAATDIDDEMILYNPSDGATHALNLTAALIWELCDGTHTLSSIAQELASDFNLPIEQARADVAALIKQFYQLGLIEAADVAPAPEATNH